MKKGKILLIFDKIVEIIFSLPMIGLLLQIPKKGVFCIIVPHMLKFWKINFETSK
jgi:hypothetical protein